MAETAAAQTTTTTQTTAPVAETAAQTTEAAKPDASKPLTQPLVSPEAANILAQARERLGLQPKEPKPADKPAEKPTEPTKDTAAAEKKEPEKPAEPPKAEPSFDEEASRLARNIRAAKEAQKAKAEAAAERAKLAQEREAMAKAKPADAPVEQPVAGSADRLKAAMAALSSNDIVGALRALKEDIDPNAAAVDLLTQIEDPKPISQGDVKAIADKLVAEKLAAHEAEVKAAEAKQRDETQAKQKADLERAGDTYMQACSAALRGHEADYPLLLVEEVPRTKVIAFIDQTYAQTGKVPTPVETLAHFQADRESRLANTPYVRKTTESAAPTAGAAPSGPMTSNAGGAPPPKDSDKPKSLEDKVRAIKARLEANSKK